MYSVLTFFNEFGAQDPDWFMHTGRELEASGAHALFILLEGLVGVPVTGFETGYLAQLGFGEFMGEMSFLDGKLASVTALAIPTQRLQAHLPMADQAALRNDEAVPPETAQGLINSFGHFFDSQGITLFTECVGGLD